MQPANLIDDATVMRQLMAEFLAALTPSGKSLATAEQCFSPFQKGKPFSLHELLRWLLTVMYAQHGLVSEQIQLTWRAGHEQKDHRFRLWRMMSAESRRSARYVRCSG